MKLTDVAAMAVDAQRELMTANNIARAVLPAEGRSHLARYADMHRARLAVCAEHFAAVAAANDTAFHPEPETA